MLAIWKGRLGRNSTVLPRITHPTPQAEQYCATWTEGCKCIEEWEFSCESYGYKVGGSKRFQETDIPKIQGTFAEPLNPHSTNL